MDTKRANLLVRRFRAGYIAEQEIQDFCNFSEISRQVQTGPLEDVPAALKTSRENFQRFVALVSDDLYSEVRLLDPTTKLEFAYQHRKIMSKVRLLKASAFEDGSGI
jgi:predicted ATPase